MKHNLLKKLLIASAVTVAITGCDTNDGTQELTKSELQPVTYDQDIEIIIGEWADPLELDLTTGVTNPEDSTLMARSLKYLRFEEDESGTADNTKPLFTGPELEQRTVLQTGNILVVDPTPEYKHEAPERLYQDFLVHPETLVRYPNNNELTDEELEALGDFRRPERFSEAIYDFTYIIDNGAITEVTRNIRIKILGEEIKAESIIAPDTIEVAKGYSNPITARSMPLDTTFDRVTYASSDESIATVDQNGIITGVEFGDFTITVSSEDGSVSKEVFGESIPLANPLNVGIIADGQEVSGAVDIRGEESVQFTYTLLPEGQGFDNEVTWSSSNPDVISIDAETGLATAVSMSSVTAMNNVIIAASIADTDVTKFFTATVVLGDNYLLPVNYGFESGEKAPFEHYWETPGGASAVTVTTDAAKDGNYGLHVVSDGSKHTGLAIPPSALPQDFGQGGDRKFRLTYDIKLNSYAANHPMRMYILAQGHWPTRVEKWHNPAVSSEWAQASVDFDEADHTAAFAEDKSARMDLYFIGGNGAIDAYFDNLRIVEITE